MFGKLINRPEKEDSIKEVVNDADQELLKVILSKLDDITNIKYESIDRGTYIKYKYFFEINKSKLCVSKLSHDENIEVVVDGLILTANFNDRKKLREYVKEKFFTNLREKALSNLNHKEIPDIKYQVFLQASSSVDEIMRIPNGDGAIRDAVLREAILQKGQLIDPSSKREFYQHMSSLFLNVILNRLGEFGTTADSVSIAESRALECRKIILDILENLKYN